MDDLFYEIYNDLPRQGPGDAECTRMALQSLPDPSAIHRILDVGCGAGLQTLSLSACPRRTSSPRTTTRSSSKRYPAG